jgi:TonB family protein
MNGLIVRTVSMSAGVLLVAMAIVSTMSVRFVPEWEKPIAVDLFCPDPGMCWTGPTLGQLTTLPLPPSDEPVPRGQFEIKNPQWIERPSDIPLHPNPAWERIPEAHVVLRCSVDDGGGLIRCGILSEEPSGLGFGVAALRLSRDFRMAPKTRDGRPTAGGSVDVPITFRT